MKIMYFNCNARSNFTGKYRVPDCVLKKVNSEKAAPHIVILTEVIPFFEDNEEYEKFRSNYFISFSGFEKRKKNSVIIAVSKELEIECVSDAMDAFDKNEDAPDYLSVRATKDGKMYHVIGFRMPTVDYDARRKLFDRFVDNNELEIEDAVTVLAGDFNNAKHYGDINRPFRDVEPLYWKQEWDDVKKRYGGKKTKVAQYNYNLHIIRDSLSGQGLELIEGENDYSFLYQGRIEIHDDHLFVSKDKVKADISFSDPKKPLDHRYFTALLAKK